MKRVSFIKPLVSAALVIGLLSIVPASAQSVIKPSVPVGKCFFHGSPSCGKSIAVFGGSLSSVPESDAAKTIWADMLGSEVTTYGVGGAGFSSQQGHSLQQQVDEAGVHDIYVLWASTNDYVNNRPCGSWTDYTEYDNYNPEALVTQCGGINYCIRRLLEINPKADIVFFTSFRFFGREDGWNPYSLAHNATGLNFAQYVEAQKQCCAHYGIPVLDQFSLQGISPFNVEQYYLPDKLHMQRSGYEKTAVIQAYFLAGSRQ